MAASLGAEVAWEHGLVLRSPAGELRLDPSKPSPSPAVVTHGHLDHLRGSAHMTQPTRDFLAARMGLVDGHRLDLDAPTELGGWEVTLREAGHCLGAAMVEAGDVLYTGDFNPAPGFTTPAARPRACDTLVIESTYGDPRFRLPPRELALASMEAWVEHALPEAGVALGAYPLGRAQELVAFLNARGVEPLVVPEIQALCDIYVRHGVPLRFREAGPEAMYGTLRPGEAMVVPRQLLAHGAGFARHLREAGGKAAYVSGWCGVYSYFDKYAIDAQFGLSDHASFEQLLAFAEACKPRRVFTVMGRNEALARAMSRRLGVPARALG